LRILNFFGFGNNCLNSRGELLVAGGQKNFGKKQIGQYGAFFRWQPNNVIISIIRGEFFFLGTFDAHLGGDWWRFPRGGAIFRPNAIAG
jgi:hypothetical protein